MRDDASGIIGRRAISRNISVVKIESRGSSKLAKALHLLSYGMAIRTFICKEFYPFLLAVVGVPIIELFAMPTAQYSFSGVVSQTFFFLDDWASLAISMLKV